jgi:hypothetical protein
MSSNLPPETTESMLSNDWIDLENFANWLDADTVPEIFVEEDMRQAWEYGVAAVLEKKRQSAAKRHDSAWHERIQKIQKRMHDYFSANVKLWDCESGASRNSTPVPC